MSRRGSRRRTTPSTGRSRRAEVAALAAALLAACAAGPERGPATPSADVEPAPVDAGASVEAPAEPAPLDAGAEPTAAAEPDWFRAPPTTWKGEQVLSAVGEATGINGGELRRSTAENRARTALRAQVESWARAAGGRHMPGLRVNALAAATLAELLDEPEVGRARAMVLVTATQLAGVIDRYEPASLRADFHARSKAWLAALPR